MPIKINGSSSGSVTLAAPASGSDVTLTLPTLGFGKVLQVVQATTTTFASTTSSTPVSTGFTGTITPSATTSKVLIMLNAPMQSTTAASTDEVSLRLYRGTVSGTDLGKFGRLHGPAATGGVNGNLSCMYLDSPATTSATTYTVAYNITSTGTGYFCPGGETAVLILVEIAA